MLHPHHQSPAGLRWVSVCSCPSRQVHRHRHRQSHKRLLCHPCHGRPGWRWPHRDSCPGCSGCRPHRCPGYCHTDLQPGRCLRQSVG